MSVTPYPGVDVVSITGEFDLLYENSLRRLVSDPTRVTQSHVVLDLSSVTFMDASGADAIVYCKNILAVRSTELSVVCPEGPVSRVLSLLNFERVLPIYADLESAMLQVASGRNPLDGTQH